VKIGQEEEEAVAGECAEEEQEEDSGDMEEEDVKKENKVNSQPLLKKNNKCRKKTIDFENCALNKYFTNQFEQIYIINSFIILIN